MEVRGTDFVMSPVTDVDRSTGFYRDTLGLKVESNYENMWVEFAADPTTLALYKPGDSQNAPKPGGAAIALAVDDVGSVIEELEGKGIRVVFPPFESPVCWTAAICDPDGNTVILHQRKDGTAG